MMKLLKEIIELAVDLVRMPIEWILKVLRVK